MLTVYIFLAITGICLGSFVNALVWRLHEQETLKQKRPKNLRKRLNELSIVKGRSMCPCCKHPLAAKDLVPVLSWISLRGKCRYCAEAISVQYPFVELLVGLLYVISYVVWPFALHDGWAVAAFGIWLVLLTGFVVHSVYDIRWYTLLDRVTLPLTIIGGVYVGIQAYAQADSTIVYGSLLGAAILFGLFYMLFQASGGAWIGGGDVKLAPLLGLLAGGALETMLLLFIASTVGTLYAVGSVMVHGKRVTRTTQIPFGPFLLLAAAMVVLYGTTTIAWYRALLVG